MRIIDVLNMVAEGKIKKGTKLILNDDLFIFDGGVFGSGLYYLENCMFLKEEDLNQEVELIPPKEKKYLVKFNMRWLRSDIGETRYLNYVKKYEYVHISGKTQTLYNKTQFTKQELQSIQPVREFLEDMEGKFELIEVEDNEID
ncbi:hypothetical protein [Enterococcus cecorum]|uniref:hypothetical protein n=1 Tax=Enterococcus cecorum TaxID=44008 RepID=UPI00148BA0CD|nr:hypothetical protein [Enterococcus cecorum]